ncbi:MAG: type II 3-dehydroquinate dehydratase [Gemmatimonadales bacterium]
MRVAVLNGPNLNLLGIREPAVYGTASLADLEGDVRAAAAALGVELSWMQTNHEGTLVEAVQALRGTADGALVNPAGLTHTSVALRDAFLAVAVPFVEVHLSNIHAREEFRRRSLLADLAVGVVAGFGPVGYRFALEGLVAHLRGR